MTHHDVNYIIVVALPQEAHGLERLAPVVHTGVGKVNASIKLYSALLRYQPDLVLNYGTAGGITELTGLHKVTHFVQIDMDARGLDVARGITPFSDEKLPDKTGLVLGTGDCFITNAERQLEGLDIEIDLVDMEAFALKRVCDHHQVLFEAYKFVSDKADQSAGHDWKNAVNNGTRLFMDLVAKEYGVSTLIA